MPFSSSGSSGPIDLSDWSTKLHFVNRALHILQLHSNPHGFLSVSSSDKLLRTCLPQIADQVREINEIIFRLGLRRTKPGGGDHFIRMDVSHVTMEQLRAGKHIPAEMEVVTEETVVNVSLALQALRENAERIDHPRLTLGIVRNHMQIIEDLCGENTGEVIHHLKALALYRMETLGDEFVCFVNETEPSNLRERDLRDGKPVVEWPGTLGELLPPSLLVENMQVETIIASLVRACGLAEDEALRLNNALARRTEELRQVAVLFEELERERDRAAQQVSALTKENERLTGKNSELLERIAELERQPSAAALPEELAGKVSGILNRYGAPGSGPTGR